MKKKHVEKKKRTTVRERDWESRHEFAFSRDQVKHRRAKVKLREAAAQETDLPEDFHPNGTVVTHTKKWATVLLDATVHTCLIDERLKERDSTLLAPGDQVFVEQDNENWVVRGVAPRRTRLSRPEPGSEEHPFEQVFAANVDVMVIVAATLRPPFRAGLVDRFLIAAQIGGVEPVLCLNKIDLSEDEPEELQAYRELGLKVFKISCLEGRGLEPLRAYLAGKTCVVCGHSGVGKSSLLNALDPSLQLNTQEVSTSDRGRHTTTGGRLHDLSCGIRIIDTAGIRALGLWDVSAQTLAFFFPELAEVAQGCKFRDCTHTHEPQCAVLEALEAGTLSRHRYDSYLRIRASLEADNGMTPGRMAAKYVGHRTPKIEG